LLLIHYLDAGLTGIIVLSLILFLHQPTASIDEDHTKIVEYIILAMKKV